MIFTASRGQAFKEEFTFKNEKGKPIAVPSGDYRLTLERGEFTKPNNNLRITGSTIYWNMTADETAALKYETLYFSLTYNGSELARGVLRVQ